jgi:hypothetical protein
MKHKTQHRRYDPETHQHERDLEGPAEVLPLRWTKQAEQRQSKAGSPQRALDIAQPVQHVANKNGQCRLRAEYGDIHWPVTAMEELHIYDK